MANTVGVKASSTPEPKFPGITVNLSKCRDTWDVEGKVHGQMKQRLMPRSVRREFTRAVQGCRTWAEVLVVTRAWVRVETARLLPLGGQQDPEQGRGSQGGVPREQGGE